MQLYSQNETSSAANCSSSTKTLEMTAIEDVPANLNSTFPEHFAFHIELGNWIQFSRENQNWLYRYTPAERQGQIS